jgi:hypothetical protein
LQAARCADIPLLGAISDGILSLGEPLCAADGGCIYNVKGYAVPFFMIRAETVSRSVALFGQLLMAMPTVDGEAEPRMNVVGYYSPDGAFVSVVLPRASHRPECYFANDASHRLVSPGALDMAGLIVTPRSVDFESITAGEAVALLQEVALSQSDVDAVVLKLKEIV